MATTAESPNREMEGYDAGLPDFIVIGAMKAGTTSLHHYLSCHPEIAMTAEKEPTFFTAEGNWTKGLDWYRGQFEANGRLRGEASPDYTKFPRHAGVPARMHAILPNAKLIYLVRDPVERLVSHYIDAYSFRRANAPLDRILREPEGRHYVACSKYFLQLEQYLPHYDFEQFLVVATEDLAAQRQETLARIFRFLGVDDTFSSPEFDRVLYERSGHRRNTGAGDAALRLARSLRETPLGHRLPARLMAPVHALNRATSKPVPSPELDPALRLELAEELRPDVEQLRAFTGDRFAAWSL
jgi:hypothetical protein